MQALNGWHLVILIGAMVLLFGAKRLPDMARAIGQSARIFKGEIKSSEHEEPPPTQHQPTQHQPTQHQPTQHQPPPSS